MKREAILKDLNGSDITWVEAVIRALDGIGHPATVGDIAEYMLNHVITEFPESAKTPIYTIYMMIYTHSQDSPSVRRGKDVFFLQERGKWGLTKWRE